MKNYSFYLFHKGIYLPKETDSPCIVPEMSQNDESSWLQNVVQILSLVAWENFQSISILLIWFSKLWLYQCKIWKINLALPGKLRPNVVLHFSTWIEKKVWPKYYYVAIVDYALRMVIAKRLFRNGTNNVKNQNKIQETRKTTH